MGHLAERATVDIPPPGGSIDPIQILRLDEVEMQMGRWFSPALPLVLGGVLSFGFLWWGVHDQTAPFVFLAAMSLVGVALHVTDSERLGLIISCMAGQAGAVALIINGIASMHEAYIMASGPIMPTWTEPSSSGVRMMIPGKEAEFIKVELKPTQIGLSIAVFVVGLLAACRSIARKTREGSSSLTDGGVAA